jgi:replication factor C subunit 2/4
MNWIEKYRPNNLNDITAQDHIIKPLLRTLEQGQLPHLLFYGPSGCGKTSTIIALAKQLFTNDNKDRVYEFNASDERGINVIRDKIKNYAKRSVNNYKYKFKIIILDEADTMTSESQFALRRIIEQYSKITRFCIICNYINKIIDPIASRCAKFRFHMLTHEQMKDRLVYICNKEEVNIDNEIINRLIYLSKGDLRKAINFLQKASNMYNKNLNLNIINEISSHISTDLIDGIITTTIHSNHYDIIKNIHHLINDGYSAYNIIKDVCDILPNNTQLSHKQKSYIYIKVADVMYHLNNSCDEEIQLLRFFLYLSKIFKEN